MRQYTPTQRLAQEVKENREYNTVYITRVDTELKDDVHKLDVGETGITLFTTGLQGTWEMLTTVLMKTCLDRERSSHYSQYG